MQSGNVHTWSVQTLTDLAWFEVIVLPFQLEERVVLSEHKQWSDTRTFSRLARERTA